MMWIIRYMFPAEPECESCNHKSFCDEGIPNCATYSPAPKRSTVMSFHPGMKKFSRPVFNEGKHVPGWQFVLAFVIFIAFVSLLGVAE